MKKHPICLHFQIVMLRNMALIAALLVIVLALEGTAISATIPGRIVSLSPAMTETLYSLGLGGRIVGVTNVCDRPDVARNKPKVGGMANPSLEAIVALKPDLVVMIREGNPKGLVERLGGLGIKTYVFNAARLAELPAAFRKMGEALGARDSAERVAGRIEAAIRTQKAYHGFAGGKKALFVIWPEPLIVAGTGTIIDDAMSISGLSNIAVDAMAPYPVISLETVIGRRPDLIIIGASGNEMKNITGTAKLLKRLGMLDAVRKGRICYVGDSLYRPGPGILTGIAELEQCMKMP
jgi:iron complex transport system substrate-binding protein